MSLLRVARLLIFAKYSLEGNLPLHTVIKRLAEHGLLQYKNTIVTSFVSKTQTQTSAINEMIEKNFKVLCLHSLQLLQNIKRYLM